MLIVKDHAGRYTLTAGGALVGQLLKTDDGWRFGNARGNGPRRAETSANRAMHMAVLLHYIETPMSGWGPLFAQADALFAHNQKVSAS